ncbi:MAG: RNA 2',3'-cyclic phosphodiesterase [Acetobacteraceae bacterium]|nr:RNA 2',3'-cyclic phosphodiesterase [Acetobacteraceae bacterium]
MPRLFVALDLPDALREALSARATGLPHAKWVPPENYHLTLRFIGEVEPWRAEEVDECLAALRARPFDLTLAGAGLFQKGGKIHSVWIGAERNDALAALQAKIETALQRIGLPAEKRRFAPHVTLARTERAAPEKCIAWVQANNLFRAATVRMEEFTLFSSRLGKEASVYTPEAAYALA